MDEQKHEGLPVAGYRPQTSVAVDLVNDNKKREEVILRTLDDLAALRDPDGVLVADGRWLAIGRTAIEQGFMAVNRSIFKPQRVTL